LIKHKPATFKQIFSSVFLFVVFMGLGARKVILEDKWKAYQKRKQIVLYYINMKKKCNIVDESYEHYVLNLRKKNLQAEKLNYDFEEAISLDEFKKGCLK
jgi:hypothetical protein